MNFDELDRRMRVYETAHDHYVLPDIFMVARLDGRSFTRLTKESLKLNAPFDKSFNDHMVETTAHLMQCGFNVLYGYTQSDEISLLFHPEEDVYNRKERKFNSILAGEASGKLSILLGLPVAFDCRICQLPNLEILIDYFAWRQEDAHRNALNGHAYWLLRKRGASIADATEALAGLSTAAKNEFLFQNGINFNSLPNWQKRGVGLYWEDYEKTGVNPVTNEEKVTQRRRIKRDDNLPIKEAHAQFIQRLLESSR